MAMSPSPTWVYPDGDDKAVRAIADALGCPEPLATVLVNREIDTAASAQQYLNPTLNATHDPTTLPDIDPALDRVRDAIEWSDSILVFADRDIDGISGAAILVTLLEGCGAEVDYLVPGKYEGYGLKPDHVDEAASRGTDLLVTVDAGTTAHDSITAAADLGIDTIVTDHHTPERELPDALAVVNPSRLDSDYPNPDLAGGGVAYKLGEALVDRYYDDTLDDYRRFALPLAALATLGDYRTLSHENRAIVREGFDRLDSCELPGLLQTADHVGVSTMKDLGWSLIPLLNAAQEDRAGEFMLEVLLERDDVSGYIETLEAYREERRAQRRDQREHIEACFRVQCDPEEDAIFLIETEEYTGSSAMHGLSEQWGKPVVTYRRRNGYYQGGGRSDPDVNFIELFDACSDLLDDHWGHPGAAGFRVDTDALNAFTERLTAVFEERYDPEALRPTVEIDAVLGPDAVDDHLFDQLQSLAPFGNGNPEPTFLVEAVEIDSCRFFGSDGDHCNLQPAEVDTFTIVSWGGRGTFGDMDTPVTLDLVGKLDYDDFAGKPRLVVEDAR